MNETSLTGRPSMFLHELMSLANKVGVGEDLVRHRFIQALPAAIALPWQLKVVSHYHN